MLLIAIFACSLWSSVSATPTGEHTCTGVVKHPVTVLVNVTEPVTYRSYTWCLRVPPRCSKYTVLLKDRIKVHKEMHNKTITVCCKGYVEMDYKCVPSCPKDEVCPFMHCNRTNHCYCSPGYTGLHCNDPCPRGAWGKDCKKVCDCPAGYTCHHLTGDCFEDETLVKKTTYRPKTNMPKTLSTAPITTTISTTLETVKTPIFKIPPSSYVPATRRRTTTSKSPIAFPEIEEVLTSEKGIQKVIEEILVRIPGTLTSTFTTRKRSTLADTNVGTVETTISPSKIELFKLASIKPSRSTSQTHLKKSQLLEELSSLAPVTFNMEQTTPQMSVITSTLPAAVSSVKTTPFKFIKKSTKPRTISLQATRHRFREYQESGRDVGTTEYTILKDHYNKTFSIEIPPELKIPENTTSSYIGITADNTTEVNSNNENISVTSFFKGETDISTISSKVALTRLQEVSERKESTTTILPEVTQFLMPQDKYQKITIPDHLEYGVTENITTKRRKTSELSKNVQFINNLETTPSYNAPEIRYNNPEPRTTNYATNSSPITPIVVIPTEENISSTTLLPRKSAIQFSNASKETILEDTTVTYTAVEKIKKKSLEKHKNKVKDFNQNFTAAGSRRFLENPSARVEPTFGYRDIGSTTNKYNPETDTPLKSTSDITRPVNFEWTTPYQLVRKQYYNQNLQLNVSEKSSKINLSVSKENFKLNGSTVTEEDSLIESNTIASFLQTFYQNTERKEKSNEEQDGHNYSMEFNRIRFNNSKTFSAGAISSKKENHYSSFTTMSLVLGVSLTTLAFLSATVWLYFKRRSNAIMLKAHHMTYSSPEPLIYDLNSFDEIGMGETNFFYPTFTNNYAERINRELHEMNYDHPRNSFSEPLYAEIRY